MQYPLCRHIKTNGTRCKAPSLTAGPWCYFHTRLHQRHSGFRRIPAVPGQNIELTALEDRESVQIALSVVINALASGQLETRRATALLYGLQLASINTATLRTEPYAPNVVRSVDSSPDGLDLARPGATIDISPQCEYDEEDANHELEDEYQNPGPTR